MHPARPGEYRVFNQFTETFSVMQLAELVVQQARRMGLPAEIERIENPRVEAEEHYYNPTHVKLLQLGLQPHLLSDVLIESMLTSVQQFAHRIRKEWILPQIRWNGRRTAEAALAAPIGGGI